MSLALHYQADVARKQAELTQQLHRTAWADLWAQGIHFFSPELAFHWRELRKEIKTFWEPMGDAGRLADLRQDMDSLVTEDENLRAAYDKAQHAAELRALYEADHADELRDQEFDAQRQEAGLL